MKHPISGEQLHFERREYRADPIEGPNESRNVDLLIGVTSLLIGIVALAVWALERM